MATRKDDAATLGGDLIDRVQLSAELGVSADTLCRWHGLRIGPPCSRVGKRMLYRREAVREWLVNRERGPVAERRR